MQQRQYRLRSYGVSTAHGDGQMLLPMTSNNNNQTHSNQSSNEVPMTTIANLTHRYTNSSQRNNMVFDSQSRRVPIPILNATSTTTSTFITSTSISTSTTTNSHQRSHPLGLRN
ncbi:unnamed protein product [Xylocopa violacea]|uniref:Uncharacterized protein n=1 Tax=Xylocopa violacea TaxID=135666 RepID=A0ABP1P818_XYLVO